MPRTGAPIKDRKGAQFGRWTVLYKTEQKQLRHWLWMCKCKCGTVRPVSIHSLVTGRSVSCGCFRAETAGNLSRTHGLSRSRIYKIWEGMITRCHKCKVPRVYKYYQGKGIKVCDRWRYSFPNFYADMGDPPPKYSIDRINGNGNYEPGNCRWATAKEQGSNKC